jgi:hypothetical protein
VPLRYRIGGVAVRDHGITQSSSGDDFVAPTFKSERPSTNSRAAT